jgi:hypothetical protein
MTFALSMLRVKGRARQGSGKERMSQLNRTGRGEQSCLI